MAINKKERKIDLPVPAAKARSSYLPPRLVMLLADEVAKTVAQRLPGIVSRSKKSKKNSQRSRIENSIFLDTSAIIDGRIFSVINLGLFNGAFVILDSVLMELKHIADSQDLVRRERGRIGLDFLEKLKKAPRIKVILLSAQEEKKFSKSDKSEVDEKLIEVAKFHKGLLITCDYNLEKKGSIQGIRVVNVNALSQALKIRAVPGEALHIKLLHQGKDITQGVGYLDDGTMIVVENASSEVGNTIDVVVSRIIQTTAGRILFAKKI